MVPWVRLFAALTALRMATANPTRLPSATAHQMWRVRPCSAKMCLRYASSHGSGGGSPAISSR